jgi:hypothetical protein
MNQINLTKRLAALIATIAAAFLVFAGGLALMNVRAEWALPLGALFAIAGPTFGAVRLWAMLQEDKPR